MFRRGALEEGSTESAGLYVQDESGEEPSICLT